MCRAECGGRRAQLSNVTSRRAWIRLTRSRLLGKLNANMTSVVAMLSLNVASFAAHARQASKLANLPSANLSIAADWRKRLLAILQQLDAAFAPIKRTCERASSKQLCREINSYQLIGQTNARRRFGLSKGRV